MNKLYILVIIGVFITLISNASALNCYQCAGLCTGSENSTTCTSPLDTCMKVSLNYPGGSQRMRSCSSSSACQELSYGIAGYGFYVNCCKTDNCNAALFLTPKYYLTIGLALLCLIQFKRIF